MAHPIRATASASRAIELGVGEAESRHRGRHVADRGEASQLLEELAQPLTALVVRAEVILDLAHRGDLDELPSQVAALREIAIRLADEADVLSRHLSRR